MSEYTRYYNNRKKLYKTLAEFWVKYQATIELSDLQQQGITAFFRALGTRFGLLTEFKRLGLVQAIKLTNK